jgi:hypothetical protein
MNLPTSGQNNFRQLGENLLSTLDSSDTSVTFVAIRIARKVRLGQDSWDSTVGTGQPRQDSLDGTALTVQSWQDSLGRTAMAGQP